MNTTAIAVEMLVIGYQSMVWMVLLVALTPFYDDALIPILKEWKELILIASVPAAYTLGAIINGIVSKIFQWIRIEDRLIYKNEKPSTMRAAILAHNPQAYEHVIKNFDYPRLLRSTTFTFLLIGVFSIIHLWPPATTVPELLLVVGIAIIGTGVALWAWYETAENYYLHLRKTYIELIRYIPKQ